MNEKLIKKIKKLLALSESSNESEAKAAMLKSQELLAKHKLSIQEIKEHKLYINDITKHVSEISFTKAKWKAKLAKIIANNFACEYYFTTRRTHKITFFGRKEDILVCNIVLEYAVDCIKSKVRRLRYEYSKDGYSTKGLENDYALGFIEGLEFMFEEQKRQNQEWGLVLIKDQEVVDAYKNINFRGTIDINTNFEGFNEVYQEGCKDGKKFSISDKIANDNLNETLNILE